MFVGLLAQKPLSCACCLLLSPLSLSLALSISLYRTPRNILSLLCPSVPSFSSLYPNLPLYPILSTTIHTLNLTLTLNLNLTLTLCALLLYHDLSFPLPSSIISTLLNPFLFLLLGFAPLRPQPHPQNAS